MKQTDPTEFSKNAYKLVSIEDYIVYWLASYSLKSSPFIAPQCLNYHQAEIGLNMLIASDSGHSRAPSYPFPLEKRCPTAGILSLSSLPNAKCEEVQFLEHRSLQLL